MTVNQQICFTDDQKNRQLTNSVPLTYICIQFTWTLSVPDEYYKYYLLQLHYIPKTMDSLKLEKSQMFFSVFLFIQLSSFGAPQPLFTPGLNMCPGRSGYNRQLRRVAVHN